MKEGSSLYIHTHSHLTIRFSHHTTDRIQSALVTVVNRKHCLIRYHGISLNNAIVTTVYWWVLEKLCLWCVNRTQSISSSVLWQSVLYMLIMMTHYKTLLYIQYVCTSAWTLTKRGSSSRLVWGAGGEQAGSPARHISTAWCICECMHTWESMFMNTCRENQRVL